MCSGTLARQRDTASIVSDALGLGAAPSVDRRFDEYDHIGLVAAYAESHTPSTGSGTAASGVPSDTRTFQAVLDRALIEWIAADQPDGWRAFASGVVEAVTDLAAGLGSGRDAVVATSGGVIATICAHLLGGGGDAVVACNRVTVNAGFTTLLAGRSGLNLLTFNDHAHLLAEQDRLLTYR